MRKGAPGLLKPASLSRPDLNQLVKVAHDEAVYICRDILFIPVPRLDSTKPLQLRPLGAPAARKSKKKKAKRAGNEKAEDDSGISEDEDIEDEDSDDEGDLASEDSENTSMDTNPQSIDEITKQAAADTARYSALSNDLDDILTESNLSATDIGTPLISPPHHSLHTSGPPPPSATFLSSNLLDPSSNKMSIQQVKKFRGSYQSGTATKSERSVTIGSKYAMAKIVDSGLLKDGEDSDKKKLTPKEAAHRLRIVQELNPDLKKVEQKKTRQFRWETVAKGIEKVLETTSSLTKENPSILRSQLPNIATKNVTAIYQLQHGSFLIMRSEKRFYVGQVLDLYKRGSSSRHGSVDNLSSVQGLSWVSLRVFLPLAMVCLFIY